MVKLLEDLYSKTVSAVRVDGEVTKWFRITVGVRHGCNLSPYLFNIMLEAMIRKARETLEVGVRMNGQIVNNLRFADDIDLIAETIEDLQGLQAK